MFWSSFRAVLEQFQSSFFSGFRAVFGAVSEMFWKSFRAVLEQFLFVILEQFWSSFRAVLEQFWGSVF